MLCFIIILSKNCKICKKMKNLPFHQMKQRNIAKIHCGRPSWYMARIVLICIEYMLPIDHFVSRFLFCITARVKCCVAAVKCCPVIHFSVVISFWSLGIIDASTIECWELRGMLHLFRLNQTESIFMPLCCY
jgi:hypothetical protein